MISAITYLPAKYSTHIREKYIQMVEALIEDVLKVSKEEAAVFNHFLPDNEICYIGADTKTIYIYHAQEFTLEQKEEMTKCYDERCKEMFGADKGMTIVIFKPHSSDEVFIGGKQGGKNGME